MSILCVKRPTDLSVLPAPGKGILCRELGDMLLYWTAGAVQHVQQGNQELWLAGHCTINLQHPLSEDALRTADGTFAYALWTGQELVVGTDAMGFYPLYYTNEHAETQAFSTSLVHLKRRLHRTTLNKQTANLMINGGAPIGAMTTIKEISRLKEGQFLRLSKGVLRQIAFDFFRTPSIVSEAEFVEQNNALLDQSVRTVMGTLPDGFARVIPITAGHDSRRLANAARQNELSFTGLTQQTIYGIGLDVDTHVAKEVMSMLGLKDQHHCLAMPERKLRLTQALEKDYWCGFESEQHDWAVHMLPVLPAHSLIADGIVGDCVVSSDLLLKAPGFAAYLNDPAGAARALHKKMTLMPFVKTSNGGGEEEHIELLESHLRSYLKTGHMLLTYMTFNRARRNVSCWYNAFLLNGHRMALPYTNVALFEQSLSMPTELRTTMMQQRCLAQVNPSLAELHSSRSPLGREYWKAQGAQETPTKPIAFDRRQVTITGDTYQYLRRSSKDRLMDEVGMRLLPDHLLKSHTWRYLPLQRLALLLEWLDCDESSLPILSMETPPFVASRSLAPTTIT